VLVARVAANVSSVTVLNVQRARSARWDEEAVQQATV